ncbi:MAG TPA: HAD-IIB family hydrolase [Candidatus Saccharimonadales bacterium]|nr:HAD-IIB family hydrolase [Candidatus Saccharimonadales bacterium]
MKKLIAFDLDGTLAPSKSTLPRRMAGLLDELLEKFQVCIISGGKYELFQHQVLSQLTKSSRLLKNLHLMPTSGTRYFSYDENIDDWRLEYAENLTQDQKVKIIKALEEGLEESGHKADKTYGQTIEDRDSQITLSMLGQEIVAELGDEGVRIKEAWDPDGAKKLKIHSIVAPKIPEFEVRASGATSIDVTKPGIDKAYGMEKLMLATGLSKQDILFLGDKIIEGGNDYAVYKIGIDCIAVRNWEDTAYVIEGITKVI